MFLGIDVGTSGVKAVLIDDRGEIVGQHMRPLQIQRPRVLWSEQNPQDWWNAVDGVICAFDSRLRAAVRAIGLSGQMHGAVVLDRSDKVLRPAILWNDGRAQSQCALLAAIEPRSEAITGNPILAGFTAPKLLWIRENEPEIFAQITSVLLPKDWVRLCMTGDKVSDMSDASGTLWLDVGRRSWSAEMLSACNLSIKMMPSLCEGSDPTGHLSARVAARWGMDRIPVAGGAGDNAAGAVGLGVVRPGETFLSLGTSGVIFTVSDGFLPSPNTGVHAFAHALPDTWHRMSVMLSAAACLDWAARLTGLSLNELIESSLKADPRSDLLFLPYLAGERTPHANPNAQGVLFGLNSGTGAAEIARAVMEGVAMGLRDGLDVLTATGTEICEITMAGGGSRSDVWGKILADTLGRPLIWRNGGEIGPALGAARLAQMAAGAGTVGERCVAPEIVGRIEPDPALGQTLIERQQLFRSIYRSLAQYWEHA